MRCPCCGNEVREDERYCSKCGQNNEHYVEKEPVEEAQIYSQPPVNNPGPQSQPTYSQTNIYQQTNTQPTKRESGALGICAIIFSVLGGWLGLLLSIIGLCTYTTPEHRTKCKVGLGFAIGWFILDLIIWLT